ncbi:hypothetical protein [Vibrio sinaloensis]|uniref:hypothetical protein n=1 Tax=Photobacterium sp. (strain ATCC 43367) TaxID=379097 RepID=UPI0035E9637B
MKWHWVTFTIAAVCLSTLPFPSNSAHCDVKTWNSILKSQKQIDHSYNFHATRFNQLLKHHSTQPLLHQTFEEQDITALWRAGNPQSQQKLSMQIEASQQVIQAIEEELLAINQLQHDVLVQAGEWQGMSEHCALEQRTANVAVSHNYGQSNRLLGKSIEQLKGKLTLIQRRYEQEVETLVNAKPRPLQGSLSDAAADQPQQQVPLKRQP